MARTYYTLAARHNASGYQAEFGDYDRDLVVSEQADMKYSNMGTPKDDGTPYRAADFKVICTVDNQDAINAGIAKLNADTKGSK